MDHSSDNNNQNIGRESLIISSFSLLSAKASEVAEKSSVLKTFCTPGSVDKTLGSGLFAGMINKTDVYGRVLRPAKSFFSRLAERSAAIKALRAAIDMLLCKPMHTFGVFLFFLGLLGGGVTVLEKSGFLSTVSGAYDFMLCVLMVIFAIPLIFSRRILASALSHSSFFKAIFVNRLGFETQKLKKDVRGSSDIFIVFLIDVILAALSAFIPMTRIVLFLFCVCISLFLLCNPEAGILVSAVMIPIADGELISAVMLMTAIGYLLKVLMGKRSIKLSAVDLFTLLYFVYRLLLLMLGGGGKGQVFAIICYFIARNLIRSNDLHSKFISCISLGVTVACALRLIGRLLLLPLFDGLVLPEANVMYQTNEFGIYLVAALPLTLACMLGAKDKRDRIYGFVSFTLSLLCVVFTIDAELWVYAAAFVAIFMFVSFKARWSTAIVSAFLLPLIYTLGEAFSVSDLQNGSIVVDIVSESGIAGFLGFALIFVLAALRLPSAVRMSRHGAMKYSVCGYGTAALILPVAVLMFSTSEMIGLQMLYWMTLGCFVSCHKMLERMTVNDEK